MSPKANDKKIYTLDDIARELGVSKSTVSRAISGKGRIGADTRRRVLDFIEAHNYHPNAVAKGLAQNKTFNIGLVLPDANVLDNFSYFQSCMNGICAVASSYDYDILIVMSGSHPAIHLQRIINNRKVDGIIVSRSSMHSPDSEVLQGSHIPYITIGYSPSPDSIYVDNDNENACRALMNCLIEKGMRRFALLGGNEDYYVTHSRLNGYSGALKQAGIPMDKDLIFMNMENSVGMAQAIDHILEQKADCIICMDDVICSLALSQLLERHVRIPQDIRIASFYDNTILANSIPSVTSLQFDARALGATACNLLLDILSGHDVESNTVPGYKIVFRDSTR